jgi:hypothetical protein
VDLASQWGGIIVELKRRRQALTAAVYGEARVESFDGKVLRLSFPEEQGFQVGMAKDRKHVEELHKVLEERVGSKPRIEVRAGKTDGGSPPEPIMHEEPAPEEPLSNPEPPPEDAGAGSAEEAGYGNTSSGAGGDDVIIRDEAEVFEMARRLFDPRNRGS